MTLARWLRTSHARLIASLVCAIVAAGISGGWLAESLTGMPPGLRFGLATVVLTVVLAALCALWPAVESPVSTTPSAGRLPTTLAALAVGMWLCGKAASSMLPAVFAGRINAYQADMLVVIDLGVKRFLGGANPYTIYHVPWEVPLPYGPYLWGPFILPVVLNSDPRMLTLIACLVVPGACIWAAVVSAEARQFLVCGLFLALCATMLIHPALLGFFTIGHTQVSWPLLLIFVWLLRAERWTAATAVAGSLVVARTTMVSIVPVLLMFLWRRGLLSIPRLVVLTAAVVIPFAPFAIADPHALWYALYGSCQKVMKGVVWPTHGAHDTIGTTGLLLRYGLERYVEMTQAIGMVVVYAFAWRAIRRGARPEPWLILALSVFSMTSLWPVIYVHFDVFVLLAAALAATVMVGAPSVPGLPTVMLILVTSVTAMVIGATARHQGSTMRVDFGTESATPFVEGGMYRNGLHDGPRTYGWVVEDVATVRIPRASRWSGTIHLVARGCLVPGQVPRVAATLNGHWLGVRPLNDRWTEVQFEAPGRFWFLGANELQFRFSGPLSRGSATAGVAGDAGRCPGIDLLFVDHRSDIGGQS